jgi:Tol biopolymer transport system component
VFGNADWKTYIVSMDGGTPRTVVAKDAGAANWSPDGDFLVYTDSRTAYPQLWVLDLLTAASSVVPESQGMVGGQWIAQDTLVAMRLVSTSMRAFDFKTQEWSDLAPGTIPNTSSTGCIHLSTSICTSRREALSGRFYVSGSLMASQKPSPA